MVQGFRSGRGKGAALASCALALAIAAPAIASGPVTPVQGDVSPLYGKINPFYGDVNATYGKINPFYGKINPFYGKINPFWGDVSSYWGSTNPFVADTSTAKVAAYGTSYDPFWGAVPMNPYVGASPIVPYAGLNNFWKGELNSWNAVQTAWSAAATQNDAQNLANLIQNTIVNPAVSMFGQAIQRGTASPGGTMDQTAQWTAQGTAGGADSGRSGRKAAQLNAAIQRMLSPYGVKFTNGVIDPASLLAMDPSQRAMTFLTFYDGMMDYAGTGHVDWWMAATGWTPAMATAAGTTRSTTATTPAVRRCA